MLTDNLGRKHDYLRISVTDNCNFRCSYCMPKLCHQLLNKDQLMTAKEIEALATIFVKQGVSKIRLTGGEPLIRKDFDDILQRLSALNVELLITTNGSLIHKHIVELKNAGVTSVNVSLDSLNPASFEQITQRNVFGKIWSNIIMLLENGFRVKLNAVAMRNIGHELFEFIELTRLYPLHVRFIEFMPFSGNGWDKSKVITAGELLHRIQEQYDIVKLKDEPHATASKYNAIGHIGTFAFITTMSKQFCDECNRLRLTAEGKMKNCLFGKDEIDLLSAMRNGHNVEELILRSVQSKHAAMGGQFEKGYQHTLANQLVNRSMVSIGG